MSASDPAQHFHETWLGMVQPSEGLVVSVPVLIDAQCMEKQDRSVQEALLACSSLDADGRAYVPSLSQLLEQVLGLSPDLFDTPDTFPKPLRLYVPEGKQELRPTLALKKRGAAADAAQKPQPGADLPAAAEAGQGYLALIWDVPPEVDLDRPETVTGPWEYPAQAKFDRLLRECRVPIGILTNGRELRLTYAPHGESSGWLSFRIDDMRSVGGRPILDACVMLLGRQRLFGVAEDQQLSALLEKSRRQQSNVTNALSTQVFEALEALLSGFASAAERDPQSLLRRALEEGEEGYVYSGLLTVLLRLVFTLYCEDRGLLPVESEVYAQNYSVLGLYEQLERDHGRYPDSMNRRYGAYARLVSLFRAIYLGVSHGDLHLPPRHGDLFDPNVYPFLEGWGAGSAPITDPTARAAVDLPAISDATVYRVLRQLILLDGQRLSYRALDVEQIGSVYEALMGFDVQRVGPSGAVRLRLGGKKARIWVEPEELLRVPPARRAAYLADDLGFDKNMAGKVADAVKGFKEASQAAAARAALSDLSGKQREEVPAGALVIQPGPERRRTSSHYTPRSLSEPIVQKTLDPLIRALGDRPSSENLLRLVICDPAMGSGAFLVAATRNLADHVVAAWTREAAEETGSLKGIGPTVANSEGGQGRTKLELVTGAEEDVVNHARRLVAQRCIYGVDKNKYAVQLARLSLWLVTMAKHEPFTFVDHALRHGDSLVGLSFDQIRAFHWKAGQKGEQVDTTSLALREALSEAISIRQEILALASDRSDAAQREKERLLADAQDATRRVRLIADLVVGAFFAHDKDKDREHERTRRLDLVERWLSAQDLEQEGELEAELTALQAELLETQTPFHWMLEFPEVFYLERPDPLDGGKVNGAAMVDAFVGNPPFAGQATWSSAEGAAYKDWLYASFAGVTGKCDLSAFFFRSAGRYVGAHGTIGLIATNTISQGDTRESSLGQLLMMGFGICGADVNLPWPGDAAVTVSVVHLAKGSPLFGASPTLNGARVPVINSRLSPKPERAAPQKLGANARLSFLGCKIGGQGFLLEDAQIAELSSRDLHNRERIFPYLGGEEVNTSPTQAAHRHVIDFAALSEEEAGQWPDLLEIVRREVKPYRDTVNRDTWRKRWWQFAEVYPSMRAAITPLSRCLVTAIVSKHLMFSFQPTDRIFSHKLYVFPFEHFTPFAVLQSRIHVPWAWLLSSTMKTDLNYSASDCFETFPFPAEDPRAVLPELEELGEQLYQTRAAYMLETDQGLTKTYNALKDPACTDPRILALRRQHEEMDAAVLRAYGWQDIPVPPFCIDKEDPTQTAALQSFEDEILDRLFALNESRAQTEAALGRGSKKKGAKKASSKKAAPGKSAKKSAESTSSNDASDAAATTKSPKKKTNEGQGSLF